MATNKFLLQSSKASAQVYVRLSISKYQIYKRKTGYSINPQNWSIKNGLPKQNQATNKQLSNKLKKLDSHIIDRYNNDLNLDIIIDSKWLLSVINEFKGITKPTKTEELVAYGNEYVENLKTKITGNGQRITKASITKYTTIVKKLKEFEEYSKTKYLLKNVDLEFKDVFYNYLTEEDNLSENTAGRYLREVKTIILDARKKGRTVSSQIDTFKGFTIKPLIVTLSLNEIEQIRTTDIKDNTYNITRDWLVLGFYLGQRVSDLLRLTTESITEEQGFKIIPVTQKKTGKTVRIPLNMVVIDILNKYNWNFPPRFSNNDGSNSTIFNKHLKEVCKIAKINKLTKGNLNNPLTNRYEKGVYPKWKLISSHICRRSFATHFYGKEGYSTPMLMSVTGHTTEKMFLVYIGKDPNDFAIQMAKQFENDEEKKTKEPVKLKVIKNASNQ